MMVSYEVKEEKIGKEVIKAWTKHCFTNKELRPINMKKSNTKIHNIFENLKNN